MFIARTWPDGANRPNGGVYVGKIELNLKRELLKISNQNGRAKNQNVADEFGFEQLRNFFYPVWKNPKHACLKYFWAMHKMWMPLALITGNFLMVDRAPSVTEGYVFYLIQ